MDTVTPGAGQSKADPEYSTANPATLRRETFDQYENRRIPKVWKECNLLSLGVFAIDAKALATAASDFVR